MVFDFIYQTREYMQSSHGALQPHRCPPSVMFDEWTCGKVLLHRWWPHTNHTGWRRIRTFIFTFEFVRGIDDFSEPLPWPYMHYVYILQLHTTTILLYMRAISKVSKRLPRLQFSGLGNDKRFDDGIRSECKMCE